MYLVQLLLPAEDHEGRTYPRAYYEALASRLTDEFGGVTAFTRAPATGLWEAASGERVRDEMVVFEVMVEEIDPAWWAQLRSELEAKFQQQELLVRAHEIRKL
jgi:hypothetical protein